ncbi:MAG TPA: hypothetical protein VD793_04835, partial [Gemmatimonadales bacterium]|nr:hypothetical protein [Gemmatimonadales bacterium]
TLEAMTWRRRVAWQLSGLWQSWYLVGDAAARAGVCWEAMRSLRRARALGAPAPSLTRLEERGRNAGCAP